MTVIERAAPTVAPRGQRGSLVLARRVLEKIAGQAAREVTAVGGRSGGLLGLGGHTDLSAVPETTVVLNGDRAEVRLQLAVAYPVPLREATDRVRQRVVQELGRQCGIGAVRVDIEVTAVGGGRR